MLTLTCRDGRVPGVEAVGGFLAHSCALSDQLVAPVAGPAHHAVQMTPGLAHHKAVLRGVRGAAVHGYNRWRDKETAGREGGEEAEEVGVKTRERDFYQGKRRNKAETREKDERH